MDEQRSGTRSGAEAAYARTVADVAGNEAVRAAEQVVCAAWAAQLVGAQEDAEETLLRSETVRDRVERKVRAAERAGSRTELAVAKSELDAAELALARDLVADHEMRVVVIHQLTELVDAAQARVSQAVADRDRLSAAVQTLRSTGAEVPRH